MPRVVTLHTYIFTQTAAVGIIAFWRKRLRLSFYCGGRRSYAKRYPEVRWFWYCSADQ